MDSEDNKTTLSGYTKALEIALGHRDMMTRMHSERVLELSLMLGHCCSVSTNDLDVLKMASSFHDIGKLGIPDHILMKESGLDDAEWAVIKKHSEIGESILLSSEIDGYPLTAAAKIVRHHHEHFDGSGYPDGLAGDDIPLLSRIISIADSYDAMAVTRSYHAARKHPEIMQVMHEETGSKFDPQLMEVFRASIEHSPMRAD